MLAETGQICLILALVLSFAQAFSGLHGAAESDRRWIRVAERSAILQAFICSAAFACLIALFMTSDFSAALVTAHSHTSKPLLYKLSGTWANHEGSMLLWVTLIAVFGAAIVVFGQSLPSSLRSRAIAVQGMISAGFGAFLVFTSNPFLRMSLVPKNGDGLNPLLQDPAAALHPPFLYLGYVGFSVAFAFAVAALIEGRVDALWAKWIRPWVLMAWSFLTIGITLGSIWAYYELGWGGWWAWDPVENVSFMPWLAGTALLHSIMVVQSRNSFIRWSLLLAIVTFSLSLVGTFIVRSGVLTSVHSFAVDPGRGIFLLALLVLATGGALWLYYKKSDQIYHGAGFDVVSREGGLVINNLMLIAAIVTVFLGTFYPLITEALGYKISVREPYYNILFVPMMSVLIVFMAFGPLLKWGQDSLSRIRAPLYVMLASVVAMILVVGWFGRSVFGVFGFAIATWLLVGTFFSYARKLRVGNVRSSAGNLWIRLRSLPSMTHGFFLAHIGLAISAIGVTGMAAWSDHSRDRLSLGETLSMGDYTFELIDVGSERGPNYIATELVLSVQKSSNRLDSLTVATRAFPVEGTITSEGSLDVSVLRTLYATVGEGDAERGWAIETYYHPLVSWIWAGAFMMALGGFVSLADQRVRMPIKLGNQPSKSIAVS